MFLFWVPRYAPLRHPSNRAIMAPTGDERRTMLTQTLAPYKPEDHHQAIHLLSLARRKHIHLDWQRPGDWLGERNICCWVARRGEGAAGLIGASVEQDGVAWLRLAAAEGEAYCDDASLMNALWACLREDVAACGVRRMAVLLQDYWLRPFLRAWGFRGANAVVTLSRTDGPTPSYPLPPLAIRDATLHDLPAIAQVDEAAFDSLWHYDEHTLWQAASYAATFTVLTMNSAIIGYQLSTHHGSAGHLARLAIDPAHQGKGYGGLIVGEMLRFFARRNVMETSVNTQENNVRSLRLYTRLGFQATGHRVPVWTIEL